jgi:hypothetical protein
MKNATNAKTFSRWYENNGCGGGLEYNLWEF